MVYLWNVMKWKWYLRIWRMLVKLYARENFFPLIKDNIPKIISFDTIVRVNNFLWIFNILHLFNRDKFEKMLKNKKWFFWNQEFTFEIYVRAEDLPCIWGSRLLFPGIFKGWLIDLKWAKFPLRFPLRQKGLIIIILKYLFIVLQD